MVTKEIIKEFGRELRTHQDPFWLRKDIMYVDDINVEDLEKEDIKAIAEWLGETVYLNGIHGSSIRLEPMGDDESFYDEVELGIWEAIN